MLTFPPETLGAGPTILPVLFRGNGLVVLGKASGIPIDEHPWNEGKPTLCAALRTRIAEKSENALKLGLARPAAVVLTDADISGCVLLADREGRALDNWRNIAGSGQLRFVFRFLAKPLSGASISEDFCCRLPVAAHFSEARTLISHKTGKKSETHFIKEEKFGEYELWRAETAFPRLHQVRLHAQESGIPVVGDSLYGSVPAVLNAYFGKKGRLNKGEVRPIYAAPCIHLSCVEVLKSEFSGGIELRNAPLPDGFSALLKKFRART